MDKLGIIVKQKLNMEDLTSTELNLFLYICRFQDDFGRVVGIHYKKTCKLLNINTQSFYNALRGLQDKAIITYKRNKCDYDIEIIDNSWDEICKAEKGYISVRNPMLMDERFLALPVKNKLFAMELIREEHIRQERTKGSFTSNSLRNNIDKFITKWTKMFRVTERTIRAYLSKLKKWFNVYFDVEANKCYITFKKNTIKNYKGKSPIMMPSAASLYRKNQAEVAKRRNRIKDVPMDILIKKLRVFTKKIKEIKNFDYSKVVKRALELANPNIKEKNWSRELKLDLLEQALAEV